MANYFEKIILPLLFSLILFLTFACGREIQKEDSYLEYYPLINLAEIYFLQKNYQKSYELYSKAFEYWEPLDIGPSSETLNYAIVCSKLAKNKLAAIYFEKSILKGYQIESYFKDENFSEVFNTALGKKLANCSDSIRKTYLRDINLNLRRRLQNMIEIDQQNNSTPLQDSTFNAHGNELMSIFTKYGYPNSSIIGHYSVDYTQTDPTILLLHTQDSIRFHYFIPKLKDYVKRGLCSPYTLGVVVDNLELSNGRPQPYGTYNVLDTTRTSFQFGVINENRKSIGLPTLANQHLRDSLLRASR